MGEGTFSVERFRLATDGDGLLNVEWGAVLAHQSWDLAWWLNAADSPLVIYNQVNDRRETLGALVSQRITGTLTAAIGLWDIGQLGVELPVILSQRGDQVPGFTPVAQLDSTGMGDVRVVPKLRITGTDRFHWAVIPAFTLPTASSAGYRGESGASFTPEMVLSWEVNEARMAINLGYRVRRNAELVDLSIEDEWLACAGVGYALGASVGMYSTLAAATSAAEPLGATNQDYLEAAAGVHYNVSESIQVIAGYGVGLSGAYGSPQWRLVAGVRLLGTRRSVDGDGDRIPSASDACPGEPEDVDGFEDWDGCPDPDNDADGVLDNADGAPNAPEDKDGYMDEDGVPDPDNDGDFILDVDDRCPFAAEVINGHEDDDGCPDQVPDSDADGLDDRVDQCLLQPEDPDGFEDHDGCPDPDNDNDGVLDTLDRCINEPGPINQAGCPRP